jgi:hypothetical protein
MDSNHRPSGYEPDELPLLHPACGVSAVAGLASNASLVVRVPTEELADRESCAEALTESVREPDRLSIGLFPAEVEGSTEGGRRKVHKAAINVAQFNATRRDSINARLHLIHERADASLNQRTGEEGVLGRWVGASRLKVALVGTPGARASALESTKDEELLLQRL